MSIDINIFDKYIEIFLDWLPISIAQTFADLHPYFVIFAVSLPIVSIVFQYSKKSDLLNSAVYLYIAGIVFIILSFISGRSKYIDVANTLPDAGLGVLNTHASYATIIILTYLIILLLKVIFYYKKDNRLNSFITFLMILEGILVWMTALTGIELVFKYGAGIINY